MGRDGYPLIRPYNGYPLIFGAGKGQKMADPQGAGRVSQMVNGAGTRPAPTPTCCCWRILWYRLEYIVWRFIIYYCIYFYFSWWCYILEIKEATNYDKIYNGSRINCISFCLWRSKLATGSYTWDSIWEKPVPPMLIHYDSNWQGK